MNQDFGDKLNAMYEAMSQQLIDDMYFEQEELTEVDIDAIALAEADWAFNAWLDKHHREYSCDYC